MNAATAMSNDTYYRVSYQDSSMMGAWCFIEASPARACRFAKGGWRKAYSNPAAKREAWTYACGRATYLAARYDEKRDILFTRVVITLHEPGKVEVEVCRASPGTAMWDKMIAANVPAS